MKMPDVQCPAQQSQLRARGGIRLQLLKRKDVKLQEKGKKAHLGLARFLAMVLAKFKAELFKDPWV